MEYKAIACPDSKHSTRDFSESVLQEQRLGRGKGGDG